MEVYVLDSLLRRTAIIDDFESLIWTERFFVKGDFKLITRSTPSTRALLIPDTYLAMNESHRIMIIKSVESREASDGRHTLTVQGWTIEHILEERTAKENLDNLTDSPHWIFSDLPQNIVSTVFTTICVNGALDPGDVIPFLASGSPLPIGDIDPPSDPINLELSPQTVYQVIHDICLAFDTGFRLIRDPEMNTLHFDIYYGTDRTGQQTVNEPVIFSKHLDNFQNVNALTSKADSRNVCYVYSDEGMEIVYSQGADADTAGFSRHVMTLHVTEKKDEESTQTVSEFLKQKGKEALAEQKPFSGFEGEVPQFGQYRYGVHYRLGDLVETRNADGGSNKMRVTEQIFVSDAEGERSYPTLTTDLYINPGSWLGWDMAEEWFEAEGFWVDAP